MKRMWKAVAVIFVCAAAGWAQNLVINGGFETEPFGSDFEVVTNDCTTIRHITWAAEDAHNGDYFVRLRGLTGDDNWLMQQQDASFSVEAGERYRVSAWFRRVDFNSEYSIEMRIVWLNSNKAYLSHGDYTLSGFSGTDSGYFNGMFDATAPEGVAYGRVKIRFRKGSGPVNTMTDIYVDDVAVEAVGTTVANYRDDFNATSVPAGWQYLWNAPMNWVANGSAGSVITYPVGNPSHYRALESTGTIWTPDGNTDGTHRPDAWARLKSVGGHPGSVAGTAVGGATNRFDRYVIAAYTVPEEGYYAVADSFLSKPDGSGDAVEVLVHINGQAPVRTALAPVDGSAVDYDINLGWLNTTDTVYVCFGGYESSSSDTFETDFTIVKYDEANDLRAVLNDRLALGGNRTIIPAGHYRQTPAGGIHLAVSGLEDKYIDMSNVHMICTKTTRALDIRNCTHTVFDGLSIDYSPLPFTQFEITSIAGDHKSFEMELIDGYTMSELSGNQDTLKVFDPSTGIMRRIYGSAVANTTQTAARVCSYTKPSAYVYNPDNPRNEQVGDVVTVSTMLNPSSGPELNTVRLYASTNLVFRNMNIYGSNMVGMYDRASCNTTYENVKVVPCPADLDYRVRAVPRYQSANRDGIHEQWNTGVVTIDNCTVDYNDDDCVNIQGAMNVVQEVSGNTVTVVDKNGACVIRPGDPVQFVSRDGERAGTAVVVSKSVGGEPSQEIQDFWDEYVTNGNILDPVKTIVITLDRTAPALLPGSVMYSLNQTGNGGVIKNCYFAHGRRYGILLRASNVDVVDNIIEYRWVSGIKAAGEFGILESGFSTNILIRGNTLDSINDAAICVGGEETLAGTNPPAGLYRDVLIVSNAISESPVDIAINSTDGWTLNDNTFSLSTAPAVQVLNSTNGNVCARYSEAFRTGMFPVNWSYLWNAPSGWTPSGSEGDVTTGPIGSPSCYRNLIPAGTMWTADGDTAGTHEPDKYIRLFESGGHPGAESGRVINSVVNAYDRYAIAAYAVPESGRYILADSCLHRPSSSGDAVEVIVHVNSDAPILMDTAAPAGEICFDTDLGDLTSGDTVYVCFGPGLTAGSDTFDMDFSIIKISDSDP